MTTLRQTVLPHLDIRRIIGIYNRAPGSEVASGKFDNPESSAALAANAFGLFIDDASQLPPLPGLEPLEWIPEPVQLEAFIRLPWSGGRHPCLDAVIRTPGALIGVESKRFEPYRPKSARKHSTAYERDVWGSRMKGYCSAWSAIATARSQYERLDVAQLVKHAFGIRTQIHRVKDRGRCGVLYYLYADPETWPDGRRVDATMRRQHLKEIEQFGSAVAGDEVQFVASSYRTLLTAWERAGSERLRSHAHAVLAWAELDGR